MDNSQYHPDWKDVIRPAILKRDGYKCSDCGIRHKSRVYKSSRGAYVVCDEFIEAWALGQGKKVFTVFLNVAHLDHDKTNNNGKNLISKCPRCHSLFDAPHKALLRNALLDSKKQVFTSSNEILYPSLNSRISDIKKRISLETGVEISFEFARSIYFLATL